MIFWVYYQLSMREVTTSYAPWLNSKTCTECLDLSKLYIFNDHCTLLM